MMRLLLLLFLCSFQALAQTDTLQWSALIEDPKKSSFEYMTIDSDGDLLVLCSRYTKFMGPEVRFLEKYSVPEFELEYSKPLILPIVNGKETHFLKLREMGDSIFVFTRYYDRHRALQRLYAQPLTASGDHKGKPILLDEVQLENKNDPGKHHLTVSPKGNYCALLYVPTEERKEPQRAHMRILDSTCTEVWSYPIEMPYLDESIEFEEVLVSDEANAVLLARYTDPKLGWSKGEPNFRYLLLSCSASRHQISEFEIELDSLSISDISIATLPNGNLLAAGLYSKLARDPSESCGVFFFSVNPNTGKVMQKSILPFPESTMELFLTERQLERERELEHFELRKVLPASDGTITLVAEQFIQKRRCLTDPRSGVVNCTEHYYYNDLLVVDIDPDFAALSCYRIPKAQHSTDDGGPYSSFALATDGAHPAFYFCDHRKNTEFDQQSSPKAMTNIYAAEVFRVQQAGADKPEKRMFISTSEDLLPVPRSYLTLSDGRALMIGKEKRGYRFCLLSGK